MTANARITAMVSRCKNRGGDCQCQGSCQALERIQEAVVRLKIKWGKIHQEIKALDQLKRRLRTKPATLREDFVFDSRYTPVMIFTGDEAIFGYEDDEGEWTEVDDWPFYSSYVWADDCERHGIRADQV